MDFSPSFERLKKTLRHEEPDRVPLIEAVVGYEIQSRFLGKPVTDSDMRSQAEFWAKAGYDHIPLTVGMMNPGEVTKESSIVGVVQRALRKGRGEDEAEIIPWKIEEGGVISSLEDYDRFPWEEAARLDFQKFFEVQPYLPEGMRIIATSGKIFTLPWMLLGFQNFCMSLYLQEELVARVFRKVGEIQVAGVKRLLEIPNVGGVWIVDDLSYGSGPMIDPKFFRRYVYPWYEEIAAICRKNDLLLLFHSDGNLWTLLDDLVSVGFHALHPIDPTCMDIRQVKEKVGKKIGILGNIDVDLLARGTPREVAEVTRKRLREIAPGGGYALGSGNSVPNWAKFENYQAMRETAVADGRYPIKF
jgi:uroporphyrinogen decarboxylase